MKKYLIAIFLGAVLFSCRKDSKSLLDNIELESLPVAQSPKELSKVPLLAKINAEQAVFGYTSNNERFYSSDNFSSYLFSDEYYWYVFDETSPYKNVYDDGNTVFTYLNESNKNRILKSVDHGSSFSEYITMPDAYSFNGTVSSPYFLNAQTGYYLSIGYCSSCSPQSTLVLHKITNGTDNIISTTPVTDLFNVRNVWFLNETIGLAFVKIGYYSNDDYKILKTTDGGVTWSTIYNASIENYFGTLTVLSETVFVLQGEDKRYYTISKDSGLTWETVDMNWELFDVGYSELTDLQFVTAQVAYAVTSDRDYNYTIAGKPPKGFLYKTIDGGDNWQKVTGKLIYSKNLFFLNENLGVVTTEGIIQKTKDGGKTFELLIFPFEN